MAKRTSTSYSPRPGCSRDPDNSDDDGDDDHDYDNDHGSSPKKRKPSSSIQDINIDEEMSEPSMASDDVSDKWVCQKCTYANYQASSMCTMCRTARLSTQIISEPPPCTSMTDAPPVTARWPCTQCTYLNVLKSLHCTVCKAKRPSEYDHPSAREDSPETLSILEETIVDLEHMEKLGKALHKWDCAQCTYKNWPSIKHCTMCGAPKDFIMIGNEVDAMHGAEMELFSHSPLDDDVSQAIYAANDSDRIIESIPSVYSNENAVTIDAQDLATGRLTFFEHHMTHLKKCVDTGCVSFLNVCYEIFHHGNDAEEKFIHYLYHYGEGNRRLNAFESTLLVANDDESTVNLHNMSVLDLMRNNATKLLSNVPRFFSDSMIHGAALPGLPGDDRAEDIHKKIRESIYEDYEMTRVYNDTSLFAIPSAVYDLRPWISSGEASLRVLMDFDDRQVLSTICCMDTYSLAAPNARQIYTPMILRNRGGGHSLVDAVSQALWGVVDKTNTLRNAIYRSLFTMETVFRSRWAAFMIKIGVNFDIWTLQRCWANIMNCNQSGFPLEQIHILVLAQILNRAIIVLPIDSVKSATFLTQDKSRVIMKHPVEGFYTHLPGTSTFRLCPPIFLGYSNGNFHAMVLPPRSMIDSMDLDERSMIHRYVRCPSISPARYVQFAMNEKEADDMVKDIVIDIDSNEQQWIYHSTYSQHPKMAAGTLLWTEWIRNHFPKAVPDDYESRGSEAVIEDTQTDESAVSAESP